MNTCKGCGSLTENCGAPIWEDVCTNKDCTYDADQFKLQMREHSERIRKDKAIRDAAPDLYEALELVFNQMDDWDVGYGEALASLAKARGEV